MTGTGDNGSTGPTSLANTEEVMKTPNNNTIPSTFENFPFITSLHLIFFNPGLTFSDNLLYALKKPPEKIGGLAVYSSFI
jgi:hypothetical protein